MTTLIEAAQAVIACANPLGTTSNVRVPKYVMAALEQAIAQEQEIVRRCKTCKSFAIRNCITCKYNHEPANSAVCTDCKHAYTSADHWEPKP